MIASHRDSTGRLARPVSVQRLAGGVGTARRILAARSPQVRLMRSMPSLALVALLASASLPAAAQRASLADRVAVLEQRAANTQQNVELLNQLAQLRTDRTNRY